MRNGWRDQLQGTWEDETHFLFYFFFNTVEFVSTSICKLICNVIICCSCHRSKASVMGRGPPAKHFCSKGKLPAKCAHTHVYTCLKYYLCGGYWTWRKAHSRSESCLSFYLFSFPHRGKMICHWRIPRMRMGVTQEGDGALTSTAVPSPPAQFPRGWAHARAWLLFGCVARTARWGSLTSWASPREGSL